MKIPLIGKAAARVTLAMQRAGFAAKPRKAMASDNWLKIVRATRAGQAEGLTVALFCRRCNTRAIPQSVNAGTRWVIACDCAEREVV